MTLDEKNKVNFRIHNVTIWLTNNRNTHCPISQEIQATRQRNLVN